MFVKHVYKCKKKSPMNDLAFSVQRDSALLCAAHTFLTTINEQRGTPECFCVFAELTGHYSGVVLNKTCLYV